MNFQLKMHNDYLSFMNYNDYHYVPYSIGSYQLKGVKMESFISLYINKFQKSVERAKLGNTFWYEANEDGIYTGKVFTSKELVRFHKLNQL
jgi:hypothetical protein